MSNPLFLSGFLFTVFFAAHLFQFCHGDLGTATFYTAPYLPAACAGKDTSVFPASNLFAAAGEGIWEKGAACGRQYQVRCFSADVPKSCVPDQIIQVTIVDRAISTVTKPARGDTTMVLSTTAYKSIVQGSVSLVNIEFREV
ncbi:EG45-like domain containing protein [Cucurbita pepo subsp. pepo]|uniref:EG45-like domain containing protein n=1 Tax=Cucurbita pepo subsp. pepo TaxID=3664 RepID=UPI000C9D8562|nr:EG45-like domain containing protein [Cucurbita pepo subsp. pepo]XP_023546767.1 EG45-like domain containing protein [Cucurbita pepo subsp. pepo]XP_023546768.1 EG45-like domain containing protein [Cucurbita pepo subsp. pepo]